MIRNRSRRMAVATALTLGLATSACATTEGDLFDDPLFWQAVSLAADYAAYEAALDQCHWRTNRHGSSYRVCGDHPRRHRPHRPHRPHH